MLNEIKTTLADDIDISFSYSYETSDTHAFRIFYFSPWKKDCP